MIRHALNRVSVWTHALYSLLFCCLMLACKSQNLLYTTHELKTHISTDKNGIQCGSHAFSPDRLYPKDGWSGDWIWLNRDRFPEYQTTHTEWIRPSGSCRQYKALFRKTFQIEKIPPRAILCITADVSFRATINGRFVCQGPVNIGSDYEDKNPPDHWFFTQHDVKQYLRRGINTIAVEVYSFALALSETTSGQGKWICDLHTEPDRVIISTDSTWKCNLDTSFAIGKGRYIQNAVLEFSGWQQAGYNDSEWTDASIRNAPREGYLIQSRIPMPIRHPLLPKRIRKTSSGREEKIKRSRFGELLFDERITLDFGRNIPAYYSIVMTGHEGDTLKIFPREKTRINRPFVYALKEGKNEWTSPQLSVFRYLDLETDSEQGLRIHSLNAIYSSYPVRYHGSFSCSDTFFTKLWDISRWTTQMCMQTHYLDSPMHQEPLACTGDYLIESLSNYAAFGDPWLTRQDLLKTARMLEKNGYDMFHTSYSLLWVQMLHNHFLYTGDSLLVRELLPHVNRLNSLFATYLDENFLVSQAPDYMFMDWIRIGGFNAHHPPAAVGMGTLTAFYYRSLILSAAYNEMFGNETRSREDLLVAGRIREGMNRMLWDDEKELYRDGIPFLSRVSSHYWLPEDEDRITYSPHVNTLAVLYDIAPKERQASILEYAVRQKEIELQPYFTYFVLSAAAHTGRFDSEGLGLMDRWRNGIDPETHTLKENWQDKTEFGYTGDFSHGWGGSPLIFMSGTILGIMPGSPGLQEIRFVPFVSDRLVWAKGTVPLTDGRVVKVSWERTEDKKYNYFLDLPRGLGAVLVHPAELDSYDLRVDKKRVVKTKSPLTISSGKHRIEYSKGLE